MDAAKPVIGIVGGIGAGKSTVAAELVNLGCARVDADAIGHDLLARRDVKDELRRRWGEGVFDAQGNADRREIARRVFADPSDLAALNVIMHGRIRQEMAARIERLRTDAKVPAIVVDAALLLETDWNELCTVLVFVDSADSVRSERVARDRGWTEADWRGRENSQKSLDIKRSKADYVIDNSSSVSCLHERVRSVYHRILQSAGRPLG